MFNTINVIRKPFLSSPLFIVAFLVGCKPTEQVEPARIPASAASLVADAVSKEDLQKLSVKLLELQHRVALLEDGESTATVRTEEEGFDIAKTRFGPFTVSSRGAAPYLDGYKVKLRIGNLTSADFLSAKLKLVWGPRFDVDKGFEAWQKAQKSREVTLSSKLLSGAFTDIDVVLTPAKPDEIKSFNVVFELNQLELRGR